MTRSLDAYDLEWKDHAPEVLSMLREFRSSSALFDVTFLCPTNGRVDVFKAHRLILAACSGFFERLFCKMFSEQGQQPPREPFVVVVTEASPDVLRSILDFMYDGVVSLEAGQLKGFMDFAEKLEIRGLRMEGESLSTPDVPVASHILRNPPGYGKDEEPEQPTRKRRRTFFQGHSPLADSQSAAPLLPGPFSASSPACPSLPASVGTIVEDDVVEIVEDEERKPLVTAGDAAEYSENDWRWHDPEPEYAESTSDQNDGGAYVDDDAAVEKPAVIPPGVLEADIHPWHQDKRIWVGRRATGVTCLFCCVCGYETVDTKMAQRHLYQHFPKQFPCSFCSSAYTRSDNLRAHCRKVHGVNPDGSLVVKV